MKDKLNTLVEILLIIYFIVAAAFGITGFAIASTWPVWIWLLM